MMRNLMFRHSDGRWERIRCECLAQLFLLEIHNVEPVACFPQQNAMPPVVAAFNSAGFSNCLTASKHEPSKPGHAGGMGDLASLVANILSRVKVWNT